VCSERQASLLPAIHNLLDATKTLGIETQNNVDKIRVEILGILGESSWREEQDGAASQHFVQLVDEPRRTIANAAECSYFSQELTLQANKGATI
jgi:hypothetical protein